MTGMQITSFDLIRAHAKALNVIRQHYQNQNVAEVSIPRFTKNLTNNSNQWRVGGISLAHHNDIELRIANSLAGDVYHIAQFFRKDDVDRTHLTEFTMIESMRCGDDLNVAIDETLCLLSKVFDALGCAVIPKKHTKKKWLSCCKSESERDLQEYFSRDKISGFIVLTHPPINNSDPFPADYDAVTSNRAEVFFNGIEIANIYIDNRDAEKLDKRSAGISRQILEQVSQPTWSAGIGFERAIMCAMDLKEISDTRWSM